MDNQYLYQQVIDLRKQITNIPVILGSGGGSGGTDDWKMFKVTTTIPAGSPQGVSTGYGTMQALTTMPAIAFTDTTTTQVPIYNSYSTGATISVFVWCAKSYNNWWLQGVDCANV